MDVAILVYDGVTAAEALGPYEFFRRVPDVEVHFVADRAGPCTTQGKPGVLVADRALADWPHPDTLVVPGGLGARRLVHDDRLVSWIAEAHRSTQWTTAVSTGSMLLGAAGALAGCDATGHWLVLDELPAVGAVPHRERLVRHGRVVTASGATSSYDLAHLVVERTFGADVAATVRAQLRADPGSARAAQGARRFRPRAGRPPSAGPYVSADQPGAGARRRWSRRRAAPGGPTLATALG